MDTHAEVKVVHASPWLRWLRTFSAALAIALLTGWATLAIYFGGAGEGAVRMSLAIAFAACSAWTWLAPRDKRKRKKVRLFWAALFLLVLGWFSSLRPSHDRSWRPEVAVLPRITIQNDRARISGLRDFSYRSREDFDVRYHDREVDLSQLTSVDLFISYWDQGPMAHTFLSFGFNNAAPVCVSIEARLEKHERFAAAASLFKRFELIYVVGDERDLVRVRTTHRGEQVYLYPIKISAEAARRLFLVYAQKINRLADNPQFYHLLKNSCTANIVRNAKAAGHTTNFDGRFILNGLVDRYLYEAGLVDTSIPFEELRRRARITDERPSAGEADFWRKIRAHPTQTK